MNIINFLFLVLVCNVKYDLVRAFRRGEELRCVEKEREALLKFKKGLVDDFDILSSWGSETRKKECCEWQGVQCSNTTGHVMALRLPGDIEKGVSLVGEISSALLDLHHLKHLDLRENDFGGNKIPDFLCSMTQLQHLDLCVSNFSGIVPPQLGNLTNLKTLFLTDNYFSGVIPPQLGNLTNLETLALANNNMRSENLNWLYSDLSLLSGLSLSESKITDTNWPQIILKLHSLHELDLLRCGLVDVKPSSADLSLNSSSSTSSLSILNLSENDLTSFTIDWFLNTRTSPVAKNLKTLNLWGNKLKTLPSSIWQLSKLEELDVSSNSLEGTITEANLNNFHNLKKIDLSFNQLTLDIKPDWTPPFHFDLIGLAGCNMGPHFPLWLRTQSRFWWLDISGNGISGEVPKWFWSFSKEIQYLNISHNEFTGAIPDYSPTIAMIDVSFNKFSGHIPLLHPYTSIFQLSQNMFSGSISSLCPIPRSQLWLLDLSYNKLAGELPNCWQNMTGLYVVNLSNNNFSGEIPHTLGYLSRISTLYLGNNNLSGKLPSTLKNCEHLYLIDIGNNKVTGGIPTWIGAYHESLTYLIFHNNRFEGGIPRQICSLSKIQVLDLSGNNLSGNIPPCFDNFSSLIEKDTGKFTSLRYFFTDVMHAQDYTYYAIVSWKRQESQYRRTLTLLKLVDLSSNRLVGDIPGSFSSLKELISLNLSKNSLTGNINRDIGQMEKLECLDLSSNHLSGTIPIGLAQLTFLAVLDLANNSLSGKIPSSTQLQGIAASGYAGNIGLCGSPLPLCPGDTPNPSANNEAGDTDDEKDNDGILGLSFFTEIVISIILGYIFGFWVVVGSLIVKESWRRAYFKFWDAVGDWLCVTLNLFWAKFKRLN